MTIKIEMDMPKSCIKCPCHGDFEYVNNTVRCRIDNEWHSFFDDKRPTTCPLKECDSK